jgi:membrane-associated phospholipid phosphatase
LKQLIRNNYPVVLIYLILLSVTAFFLTHYGKVQIHLYLNQFVGNPAIDTFFYYITFLGDGAMAVVLLIGILFYNVRLGICSSVSFITAALTTNFIKYFLYDDAMRPYHVFKWFVKEQLKLVDVNDVHIHNSFPSGHSTQAFAIFICLSLFARSGTNKMLFLAIALLSAFSRVYLSQHWLVDITVGSIIGTTAAFLLFHFIVNRDKLPSLNTTLLKAVQQNKKET